MFKPFSAGVWDVGLYHRGMMDETPLNDVADAPPATTKRYVAYEPGADARGEPRKNFMDRLQWLVAECDRRGVIVDVTLARGKGVGRLPDLDSHCRAVESLSLALKQNRNWYVDLANERDVRDDRYVSPEDLKTLRAALRRIDPLRLATASFGGHDLDERDLRDALVTAELDFVCPHRPRHSRSSAETEVQTRQCLSLMRKSDKVVPVLYQEPFRRGYTAWEPTAADFLTDLRGAVSGGAAGWCLHNGTQKDAPDMSPRRSFDLRGRRLFEQLDSEELKVVQDAASTARQSSIPVGER
jgi:hypothetical protein